jgi:dTDP-4-dehydrorhamnose reductase
VSTTVAPRLLITGISGLLGLNLAVRARTRFAVSGCYAAHPVALPGIDAVAVDVRSAEAFQRFVDRVRPDVVIHTVGMSSVDACENDPGRAQELNVDAAEIVARAARGADARLVHISTDHLFDGARPRRREDDPLAPLNAYAKTKAEAEALVLREHPEALVVRTNFYGWGTSVRVSFSDWVLRALRAGEPLTMFPDVYFSPLFVDDLADAVFELVARRLAGVVNVAGGERLSKYEFALRTAEVFGLPAGKVHATSIERADLRAPRPRDMSLDVGRVEAALGRRMPTAREGLMGLRRAGEQGRAADLEQAVAAGRR